MRSATRPAKSRNSEGSPSLGKITIRSRVVDGHAEDHIEDTGSGMNDETLARIFDPFFTTKPVGKGTGQGLTIAHRIIVERHQGDIKVRSTLGVGTCFTIRLPLVRSEAAAA